MESTEFCSLVQTAVMCVCARTFGSEQRETNAFGVLVEHC